MFSNRFIKVLFHPLLIGLVITIVIYLLTPTWFNKFTVKEIEHEYLLGNVFNYYVDLNNDGYSEKFLFDFNSLDLIKIQLFRNSRNVLQYNLNYDYAIGEFISFFDFNRDSVKELFVFGLRNDSIYLNILGLLSDDMDCIVCNRFIDILKAGIGIDESPTINIIGLTDYTGDGSDELIFCINTGFRKQPRNCYVYDIAGDKLITSTESGASVFEPRFFDLTGDKLPEIIFGTRAVGNTDVAFPYSDQFGWMMVLDHRLEFVFEPVRYEKYPCSISVIALDFQHCKRIVALKHYYGDDTIPSTLGLYNEKGKLIRETTVELTGNQATVLHASAGRYYLVGGLSSHIEVRDTTLKLINTIRSPSFYSSTLLAQFDADGDGIDEYIFKGRESGLYYLVRNDFSSFTELKFGTELHWGIYFSSMKFAGADAPLLHIPQQDGGSIIKYSKNPFYSFRYLIYAGVYLAVCGILYLLYLMQSYRARIHFETTRKINELQLRSVKSQMDPHFAFNVLNSIGSLYSQTENREKADYLFGKYARMLRDTIVSADQTEISLEQELVFVRNYLDIEKFRIGDRFSYRIDVGNNVDMNLKIPRMLVHTFAENAVKYAVRQVEGEARLNLVVGKTGNKLYIKLEDNGPGLHGTKRTEVGGTGKGLAIVDEMIRLYYDLTKTKISYRLTEVMEQDNCKGTLAEIIFE